VTTSFPHSVREAQRQATRQQLIGAALLLVAEQGFAGATTAAVARAVGKAHGTVFVHFPTRDALVEQLVAEIGSAMSQQLLPPVAEPAVAEVLDAHLAALQAHEVLYARLLTEAATLPAAARARVFALQSGIAFRLRQAVERAVAAGAARALDPTLLANSWIALTNHYLMHRDLFAPGDSVIATHRAALKAWLLELLRN
jgi:AcrR family transcriptional regulator